MVHLTLAGLSADRKRLLLVNASGEEFTLDIDRPLRAAIQGEQGRLGQLEIEMESALRPRDIQARIRAGESPETVATAAQTTVEKIMPFAAPVLAERAHIAERAQGASLRARSAGSGSVTSGARTLGEGVRGQLKSVNVDPDQVEWDSYRRDDGRWCVSGSFRTPERKGTGRFIFDLPGNYVTVDDEDGRWLVGELPAQANAEQAEPPTSFDPLPATDSPETPVAPDVVRRRRLSAVPNEELPLGDDTDVSTEPEPAPDASAATDLESTVDLTETAKAVADQQPPPGEPTAPPEPAVAPPTRRPVRKTRGRASVPSWDEIMFGSGEPADPAE